MLEGSVFVKKAKETKTNAMRILDRYHVPYQTLEYECGEFIDGVHVAELTGVPVEQSFKTLVLQGKSRQYYVFILPVAEEINLKLAAKLAGEKSVDMIHVKDIREVTGYIRGGCSPIGMKKQYPAFLHQSALMQDKVYISGGRLGTTLCLAPEDLAKVAAAKIGEFLL